MTCSAAGDEKESYLRRPCCSNSSFGPILSCFFRSPLRSPLRNLSLSKQSKSLLLRTRKDESWQNTIENETELIIVSSILCLSQRNETSHLDLTETETTTVIETRLRRATSTTEHVAKVCTLSGLCLIEAIHVSSLACHGAKGSRPTKGGSRRIFATTSSHLYLSTNAVNRFWGESLLQSTYSTIDGASQWRVNGASQWSESMRR